MFFPTSGFKWIDPKTFDLNKYRSNNSKGCILLSYLQYVNYIVIILWFQTKKK